MMDIFCDLSGMQAPGLSGNQSDSATNLGLIPEQLYLSSDLDE